MIILVKTIVLHFYAIDCFSCLDELPNIEKIYNDYNQNKDDVIILSIANTSRNPKKDIIDFLKENNYTFISLMAKNKLFNKYYVTTYPNTYIIILMVILLLLVLVVYHMID